MKNTSLTVSRTFTLNLGNYNSVKVGASISADMDEGDQFDQCYEKLRDQLDEKLERDLGEFDGKF